MTHLLSLGLRLLFLLLAVSLTALVLDVLVVDGHGLIDLGAKGVIIIDTKIIVSNSHCNTHGLKENLQIDQFLVVHLQKHTSNLASQLRLQCLNFGEDGFS